jgi:hypothetical protein
MLMILRTIYKTSICTYIRGARYTNKIERQIKRRRYVPPPRPQWSQSDFQGPESRLKIAMVEGNKSARHSLVALCVLTYTRTDILSSKNIASKFFISFNIT